jgi:hypothetical protein
MQVNAPRIASLTQQVLVARNGGTQRMHAPSARTADVVEPMCMMSGSPEDYRLVEAAAVASHYDTCDDCFALVADRE